MPAHAPFRTPPRLYVLPARSAPVAAVLLRGPSEWCHVLRWDLEALMVEPGAWMHATLYPRRCDISSDGALLCAFILASRPPPWDAYYAVSKLPWLKALAAWRVGSTWAPPCQFHADGSLAIGVHPGTPPDHGSFDRPLAALAPYPASAAGPFTLGDVANELRRGWTLLAADAAAAAAALVPVPATAVLLAIRRGRPGDAGTALVMVHAGHDFRQHAIAGVEAHYLLEQGGRLLPLDEAMWADWSADGRLLVATREGALQVHDLAGGELAASWSHDLTGLEPSTAAPPAWATHW